MTALAVEPITDANWSQWGRCLEIGPEVFFCEPTESGRVDVSFIAACKAVCGRCEVLEFCRRETLRRERGLKAYELAGVVGAMTARDRAAITSVFCRGCKERPRSGPKASLCRECVAEGVDPDAD
jgi:hypothetical protein